MKLYELVLDQEEASTGIDAISLVEHPAMEAEFIALSKEAKEMKFATMNEEKRIVMGAVMIPDKKIYRNIGGNEFYVYASAETIRQASQRFMKNSNQNNATLEHESEFSGGSVVESWIVDDPMVDKSRLYNMSMEPGTWMISMKIDNTDVWNDYVKEGRVSGFSIEGLFKTEYTGVEMSEQRWLESLHNEFSK